MTEKLAGKVALVIGGSAGIGVGIARQFAKEGARVFITGRHRYQLDEAVTSIGANAAAIQGDVSNLADLDRIYVLSPLHGHLSMSCFMTDEEQAAAVASVPLGHIGMPEDLGKARCSSLLRTAPTSLVLSCSSMARGSNLKVCIVASQSMWRRSHE